MTRVTIIEADVVDWAREYDGPQFHALISDPPYLLSFMGKEFDKQHKALQGANDGQKMQAWHAQWIDVVMAHLLPGAHSMTFGGSRTSHRLTAALEDAGMEIRDSVDWVYGSG